MIFKIEREIDIIHKYTFYRELLILDLCSDAFLMWETYASFIHICGYLKKIFLFTYTKYIFIFRKTDWQSLLF